MGDNLLESYNPLYDVHLRQYFALPHMQKHLRNLGLLEGSTEGNEELHEGHLQMMDMMLRNRERVLQQLVDLQRKLDAAEKVELYRRIRSGVTNAEELERSHVSRSLSRPVRSALGNGRFSTEANIKRRQQSHSPEAGDLIKRVETDYRADSAPIKNSKSIYNRLAANAYKYQYLHKLDDRTLRKYMNSLRKQLAKLERFREVSFGPHTMAKHQPTHLQQSWFFRRRSLPSLEAAVGATNNSQSQQTNGVLRSLKSGQGRKSRSGKSQSPRRATTGATADEPLTKMRRTSMSRTRASQKLPPLPQAAKRSFAGNRTMPGKSMDHKLPPTAVIKQAKKAQERPTRRPQPSTVQTTPRIKGTQIGARPPSQKGSITPVKVQKPPSFSGALPVIGTVAAVGAGVSAIAATMGDDEERKEEENLENVAPSPSISLAASQTTTTDGQPAGDSEWEGDQVEAPVEIANEEETRQTPGPYVGETEVIKNYVEDSDGQLTARVEVKSVNKEELKEEEDKAMEDKENEDKVWNEREIEIEEVSPRREEELASGLEMDVSKNISSPEIEDSSEIPPQACSLQQQRAKREAAMAAEEERVVEEVFEQPQQKEEQIIEQHSPEILMNGGQYGQNEEIEGSEHSVEIKEENVKEEEPMDDEIDKRVSDSRVSFEKVEDSIEKREEYSSERQKSEEALVEMEELSHKQMEEEEENFQKSPLITPSIENKSWDDEEKRIEKLQNDEEEKVSIAESTVEEKTSLSHHSESVKDVYGELEESPRMEVHLGEFENRLDSSRSVGNGFGEEIGHEEEETQLEAERDLEHRYEIPESTTVADYTEEPSGHFNNNEVSEDESPRTKREVEEFGEEVKFTGREEGKHLGAEEEEFENIGRDYVHTGIKDEEHIGRETEELKREELYSESEEQHTGRIIGKEEGEDEFYTVGENKGEFEKEQESFGKEEHVIDSEGLTGREEHTEREEVKHTGRVEDEHFEGDEHSPRDSLEQIKGPDETEFEPLVESESVQPTNDNTSRKLSGSDKYIIESGDGEVEERPETMLSLGNNSHVLPNPSELDYYSKSENNEENGEIDLVHSEESEYNRPESTSKFSVEDEHEIRHELFESGQEGPVVQHEEISKDRNEDAPEVLSQKTVDMSTVGQEDIESRPEEQHKVISDVRRENEGMDHEFENQSIVNPEYLSEINHENVHEDRPIEEFTAEQNESPVVVINEDDKHFEDNHDPETFRSEHSENRSLNEKEEVIHHSMSPTLSADVDVRSVGTNQSKAFLQQPSIEITPASDHGEFVEREEHFDQKSEHSHPMTPVGEEHEHQQWRNYEQQDIHQEENHNNDNSYQEQLIDFSSSPTAQGDEIIDSQRTQHSPHQNGHLKSYNEEENEDDEHTSLLTYRGEFEGSPSKKSNNSSYITGDKTDENGHLLMGNGENSGRLSSSSIETEGADDDNNNSDDSSVVIRQGTSNLEHGQQQFQHSKLENESRIEM